MKETFDNIFSQFGKFWSELSLVKKSIGISTIIITLGVLATVVSLSNKSEYEYLFVNLSQEDVTEISQNLRTSGFDNFVIDKKGIKVNKQDVTRLRLQVAQAGLPRHGLVGWEKV